MCLIGGGPCCRDPEFRKAHPSYTPLDVIGLTTVPPLGNIGVIEREREGERGRERGRERKVEGDREREREREIERERERER